MDAILKINDDHKRAFAVGFRYIFTNQTKMNRSEVALLAKVQPSTITYIMRGYEERFPSLKAQDRIARVFGADVYSVVEIGRKIQDGLPVDVTYRPEKKPRHSDPEVQEFIEHFNLEEINLDGLSICEKEIIKLCRVFSEDEEILQDFFDFAGDLFVSFQSKKIKKIIKKK